MRGSGRPGLRAAHGAGILGLVGCLILVAVLVGIRPDPITDFRRSYRDVGIGEQGQLRAFDITVTGVSRVAAVPLTEGAYVSDQTLIVVELEGSATTARAHFSELTLMTADGHSYDPRPEFSLPALPITQPGFTSTGSLIFEVPPDRLEGANLVVDPDPAEFDAYDIAVRVELGLDESTPVETLTDPLPEPVTSVRR